MFEQEDGEDPFTYFSKSGTGANAFTSFDRTQYICYGTKSFYDNLSFLISYVNSPYYTDENVEKEKGIIAEKLNMYADMPDWQVETKLREAIYTRHPMFTPLVFGSSSLFRERVRNKRLINNISSDWESISGFKNYLVIASTNEPDKIDRIRNMNIEEMNDIISKIDFDNTCYIKCLGEE